MSGCSGSAGPRARMRPGLRKSAGWDGAATPAKLLAASPEDRNAAMYQAVQLIAADNLHLLIGNGDGSAWALTRTMCLRLPVLMTAQDLSHPTDGLDDTCPALALQFSYMRFDAECMSILTCCRRACCISPRRCSVPALQQMQHMNSIPADCSWRCSCGATALQVCGCNQAPALT